MHFRDSLGTMETDSLTLWHGSIRERLKAILNAYDRLVLLSSRLANDAVNLGVSQRGRILSLWEWIRSLQAGNRRNRLAIQT